MFTDNKDKLFCEVAIDLNYLTSENVEKALEQQRVDQAIGVTKPIGAYLFESQILTKEQITQILKIQNKYEKPGQSEIPEKELAITDGTVGANQLAQQYNRAQKIILGAGAVAFFSLFLPWVNAGIIQANGFQQEAYFFLLFIGYPVYRTYKKQPFNKILAGILAAMVILITWVYIYEKLNIEMFGKSLNVVGGGAYFFFLALIATFVGIIMHNNNQMSLPSPTLPVVEANPEQKPFLPAKSVKLLGGVFVLFLLVIALFGSGNSTLTSLERHLSEYRNACNAGDVEKMTSFLPPQFIEQAGGITKMTEVVRATFETAKQQGLDLTKLVYGKPGNIQSDGQCSVTIVPTSINFKMYDGASATLKNSVIAISTNGGSTFFFFEGGDQGKEFLKQNYPKLLEMVSIPIAELLVIKEGKTTQLELRAGNWVEKQEMSTKVEKVLVKEEKVATKNLDQQRQEMVGREGEVRRVGTTVYKVVRSWWQDKLSNNEVLEEHPDANFLLVQLIVRNDDKEARTIPPFKLVDETGGEHETTDKAYAFDGSIGVLESLNPGVQKEGVVIFDCLQTHRYSLKVSGGFWSAEDALITLTPQNDQHVIKSNEVSEKIPTQDNLETPDSLAVRRLIERLYSTRITEGQRSHEAMRPFLTDHLYALLVKERMNPDDGAGDPFEATNDERVAFSVEKPLIKNNLASVTVLLGFERDKLDERVYVQLEKQSDGRWLVYNICYTFSLDMLGSLSAHFKTLVWVNCQNGLNIRDKPGKNGKKVGLLPARACVKIVEQDGPSETLEGIDGKWVLVSFFDENKREELQGWCFSGFLSATEL
jgi:hypothetical protein